MAQMLIRNLSDAALEHVKTKARRNGRSTEAEAREIIERDARAAKAEWWARVDALRTSLEGRIRGDSTELIREDRDR